MIEQQPTKAEVIARFKEYVIRLQQIKDVGQGVEAARRMAEMYKVAIKEMEQQDRREAAYRDAADGLAWQR